MFRINSVAFTRAYYKLKSSKRINQLTFTRRTHSDVIRYRRGPAPAPKKAVFFGEFLGGFFWWWTFWHLYYDFGHVVGEFDYPDPTVWTDEELGITDYPIDKNNDDENEDDEENKLDEAEDEEGVGEEEMVGEDKLEQHK